MPWALRASAQSFPIGTGVGAENIAPRALARLSEPLLRSLCAILMAVELSGRWPSIVQLVLIVLLPKPDGGRRPIGLFPAVVRVWARARRIASRAWEACHASASIFGGTGMGAQRAAWQCAFRAENAALCKLNYAQALLDLVKAFEKVPHHHLARAARKRGYNLWLLRASIAAYRLPRAIGVDGVYTSLIIATCGITAGSVFATTELRLLMMDALDFTCNIWTSVQVTLYVDDATIENTGPGRGPEIVVAGATDAMIHHLEQELELEVSLTKSTTNAATWTAARRTARASTTGKLTPTRSAKLLGTPSGGGRKRCVRLQRTRLATVRKRITRIRVLRKSKVRTALMVRAACTPALTYGWDVMGVSDSTLRISRSAIAAAVAPAAGGKNPAAVLLLADAGGGTTDPAFDAHALLLKQWALAWWQQWQHPRTLRRAFHSAAARLRTAERTVWDLVTGPVTALLASVWRLGWTVSSPSQFWDDMGNCVDFCRDSPAAVQRLAAASVRRWQFAMVMADLPTAIPDVCDFVPTAAEDGHAPALDPETAPKRHCDSRFDPPACAGTVRPLEGVTGIIAPVARLLYARRAPRRLAWWTPTFRPYLRSAVSGGQWPQVRRAQAMGDDVDTRCQLCFSEPGTLAHRFCCPALLPERGWPVPPRGAQAVSASLAPARLHTLRTRGLLALRVHPLQRQTEGWIRWVVGSPDLAPCDATWFIDGSLIDGAHDLTARTGFAIAIVSSAGALVACAYGVPPAWVRSAAAAEAWALLMALREAPGVPRLITDCLELVRQLARGLQDATDARRPLARLWQMMSPVLDGVVPEGWVHVGLLWMPSHCSRTAIGVTAKSDGTPITRIEWRANRLVDALAKTAAATHRTPARLRQLLQDAADLVEHHAALLGWVTHDANNYVVSSTRPDGTYCQVRRRDAMPAPFDARGVGVRPHATGPRGAASARPDGTRPTDGTGAPSALSPAAPSDVDRVAADRAQWVREAGARRRVEADRRADDAEAASMRQWWLGQAQRPRRPAPGLTAAERLEALRQRVATRSAL